MKTAIIKIIIAAIVCITYIFHEHSMNAIELIWLAASVATYASAYKACKGHTSEDFEKALGLSSFLNED